MSIRAFTVGYDFYAPERSVCFHHYNREKKVKYFNENQIIYRDDLYPNAMKRLVGIVHLNPELDPSSWDHRDEHVFGLGGVRTPEKFFETFGIDVNEQKREDNMCTWVNTDENSMHSMFTPHLRADGMGIDYDKISFKFKDPGEETDYGGTDDENGSGGRETSNSKDAESE